MSVKKDSAYMPQMVRPVIHATTIGHPGTHLLSRLRQLLAWLTLWWNRESRPGTEMGYQLGNEYYTENGYYRVSEEKVMRERAIDIQSLHLSTTLRR